MSEPTSTAPRVRRRRILAAAAATLLTAAAAAVLWPDGEPDGYAQRVSLATALDLIEDGDAEFVHIDDRERSLLVVVDGDGVAAPEDGDDREVVAVAEGDRLPEGRWKLAAFPVGYGPDLAAAARDAGVELDAQSGQAPLPLAASVALTVLPALIIVAVLIYLVRAARSGTMSGTGTMRRRRPVEVPDVRFADVAGCDEAVDELSEAVGYLADPERLAAAGATAPRGYLLTGPPGTGKTLLARAVAGEAGVPFFAMSGSEFVEIYVGAGSRKIRRAFADARDQAPAIVFIDEIDAVGKARVGGGPSSVGVEEREQTLNQLLIEMDGFKRAPIVVIAATNREDVLDPALTRPGRLERRVAVPLPDVGGRRKLLDLYLDGKQVAPTVDLDMLARRTSGMSGADIEAFVNTAALAASRTGSTIDPEVLDDALAERRLGRARRSAVVSDADRQITCWHEAGHAAAALIDPDADEPVTVTIIPRGQSGGATHFDAPADTLRTGRQARAQLRTLMAGRAAEELLLDGDATTGAAGDIAAATSLAVALVAEHGLAGQPGLGMLRIDERFGGELARDVARAAAQLTDTALNEARHMLAAHRDLVADIAEALEQHETLTGDELRRLHSARTRLSATPLPAPSHQTAVGDAHPNAAPPHQDTNPSAQEAAAWTTQADT